MPLFSLILETSGIVAMTVLRTVDPHVQMLPDMRGAGAVEGTVCQNVRTGPSWRIRRRKGGG